jgi:hypothetical protein
MTETHELNVGGVFSGIIKTLIKIIGFQKKIQESEEIIVSPPHESVSGKLVYFKFKDGQNYNRVILTIIDDNIFIFNSCLYKLEPPENSMAKKYDKVIAIPDNSKQFGIISQKPEKLIYYFTNDYRGYIKDRMKFPFYPSWHIVKSIVMGTVIKYKIGRKKISLV